MISNITPDVLPGSRLNINMVLYGDSHYKDKMVVRPSYLYNGNPYTGKMIYLYWDVPQPVRSQNVRKSPYTNNDYNSAFLVTATLDA